MVGCVVGAEGYHPEVGHSRRDYVLVVDHLVGCLVGRLVDRKGEEGTVLAQSAAVAAAAVVVEEVRFRTAIALVDVVEVALVGYEGMEHRPIFAWGGHRMELLAVVDRHLLVAAEAADPAPVRNVHQVVEADSLEDAEGILEVLGYLIVFESCGFRTLNTVAVARLGCHLRTHYLPPNVLDPRCLC